MPDKVSTFRTPEDAERFVTRYDEVVGSRWPVAHEELDVSTRFGQTRVRRSGAGSGVPLVMLHPTTGSSAGWYPVIELFCRDRIVYTPDTMGAAGRSVQTAPIRSEADLADWLDDVLDRLGMPEVHLLGCNRRTTRTQGTSVDPCSHHHRGWSARWSRPGARCRHCRSVSPGRSPNPPCGSHRNGLSIVSAVVLVQTTVKVGLHPRYPPPRTHPILPGWVVAGRGVTVRWRIFRHYSLHSLLDTTAVLRPVTGSPGLGLLRRLRPIPGRSADGVPSPTATLDA